MNIYSLLLSVLLLVNTTMVPDNRVEGIWIAEFQRSKYQQVSERLWITLKAKTDGKRYGYNFTIPLKSIEEMNIRPGHHSDGDLVFVLSREAGELTFTGSFVNDTGSGTFVFSPHEAFLQRMNEFGYRNLTQGEKLHLAIYDVTSDFVEELQLLGYDGVNATNK